MNEQQIRQLIQQEIRGNETRSRFGIQSVPYHIHNNVDAPTVFTPYGLYAGFVPSDGDVNSILGCFLPSGWTLSTSSTGVYTIVHNLGTNVYAVVADASQSTNEKVAPVVASDQTGSQFTISWFRCSDGTSQDTSFTFILMQVNNSSTINTTYLVNQFT